MVFGHKQTPKEENIPFQVVNLVKQLKTNESDHIKQNYKLRLLDIKYYIENAIKEYDTSKPFDLRKTGLK